MIMYRVVSGIRDCAVCNLLQFTWWGHLPEELAPPEREDPHKLHLNSSWEWKHGCRTVFTFGWKTPVDNEKLPAILTTQPGTLWRWNVQAGTCWSCNGLVKGYDPIPNTMDTRSEILWTPMYIDAGWLTNSGLTLSNYSGIEPLWFRWLHF